MVGQADLEPLIRENLPGLRRLYASLTLRSASESTVVCERDFMGLVAELTQVRVAAPCPAPHCGAQPRRPF